ncbi:MAG: HypC/HybG/HupF family hydrogenase formation chaperone [Sporichthyaceae bacterium]|nr:HypC/HybG/HupF family hydrogenase formation chaperone [Sporichthyaceae bacterium]
MCLGIPGQIVEIGDRSDLRATVDVEGVLRDVSVALIGIDGPDCAKVGDWVLVHLGFALSKIDETEAKETLDALAALTDMYEHALADPAPGSEVLREDGHATAAR